ncbi:cytosine permease [Streptomyces sp. NPDC056242]|uniref:cytosine permease n=1 Tax=unclassified Streptomyces TaxID=2593676 RepID=UPI0035E075E6
MGVAQDYTDSVVPQSERRSNVRMMLTFLSMQATFGAAYVGYTARFEGLTFTQLIVAMAIATAAMSLYCFGAANTGAAVGQTTSVMTRGVFGRLGSRLVSVLLVINGMGFYVFTVLFVMSLLGGLFTVPAVKAVSVGLAFLMITNTYFGFSGVQRFAQYVAVPVVMIWGLYATIRGLATISDTQLHSHIHVAAPSSMLFVTGAMVGLSTWGNEADVFRYAKMRPQWNVPTIIVSYLVGSFMFPVMGYVVAVLADQADFGPSIKYFVNFSLFGLVALGFVFFIINQAAVNDGNLYIAVNGVQNLTSDMPRWRRQYTVLVLAVVAAGLTLVLPSLQKTFNIVTGIGAVTVPTASTVMAVDYFLIPRLFGLRRPMERVTGWKDAAAANWPGVVAVIAGTVVGAATGGLIPGTSGFQHTYIGFPALQAWVTGAVVYLIGVALVHRRANARALLGFPYFTPVRTEHPAAPAPVAEHS